MPIVVHLPIGLLSRALPVEAKLSSPVFENIARGNRLRRQCSFVNAPVSGLCPRSPEEHPPSPSHGVSPVMRPLQPHGCWRTVNKADYFAACNFYLFLRTYVSLTAGPLITVRNAGDTVAIGQPNDLAEERPGHVDVPESATESSKASDPDYIVIHTKPFDTSVRRGSLCSPFFFPPRTEKRTLRLGWLLLTI